MRIELLKNQIVRVSIIIIKKYIVSFWCYSLKMFSNITSHIYHLSELSRLELLKVITQDLSNLTSKHTPVSNYFTNYSLLSWVWVIRWKNETIRKLGKSLGVHSAYIVRYHQSLWNRCPMDHSNWCHSQMSLRQTIILCPARPPTTPETPCCDLLWRQGFL